MQAADVIKALANERRLQILDWLKQPRAHFPPQVDGDLDEDGVCALLIAEKLLQEDRSGPVSTHMQSLNMLVCTEGRERTLSEYTSLLRTAGFGEIRGHVTGAPLDAVLAFKN